jgi:hypothetical protein
MLFGAVREFLLGTNRTSGEVCHSIAIEWKADIGQRPISVAIDPSRIGPGFAAGRPAPMSWQVADVGTVNALRADVPSPAMDDEFAREVLW